ncbi:hypothetical protein CHGG_08973 [Chaetomium globosum CBS 148.51]|uniref:Methyltransferase OMS1, mitochondrial n=1 Tax=Chaetomium globosum (strain ATCC 6205 / CBS 148.51 / DSM 1962 / NBRC 6347 / NRRL 1970) TaxID=306901 RepID=Q2GST1_CHAGB|nr:uncharacterized protein CHGG_08973 [Chaetomium globosum CBS 148.51]EAQ84959.1 hypothetical protein CHGG_08973 [Chaetomium globosum CBS 148.51]
MASRFRLPRQLTAHLRCPRICSYSNSYFNSYSNSYSRNFTLSATLQTLKQEQPPRPFSRSTKIPNEPQPLDYLVKELKWPLFGAGISALAIGLYISLEIAREARGHVLEVAVGTGRNLAHYTWDEVISQSQDETEARAARERERLVRLLDQHRPGGPALRGQQHQQQHGHAIGSLPGEVLSFTGVDVSADMMAVARDRIRSAVPGLDRLMRRRRIEEMPRLRVDEVADRGLPVVEVLDGRVRLVLGDALRGLPPPPAPPAPLLRSEVGDGVTAGGRGVEAPTKYDTIIQTFGLCSVADPARLLANMAGMVQPDTGRVLLVEHGRGSSNWVNKGLDETADKHFRKFGCWWNRDIEKLVLDAVEDIPGLELVRLERPLWLQAGTTLLIELKVNSQALGYVDHKPAGSGRR